MATQPQRMVLLKLCLTYLLQKVIFYSDIVTVTVGEIPVEPDNPDKAPENSGGCSSAFNIAESFGIISVACAFGAIVCVLRRKRND